VSRLSLDNFASSPRVNGLLLSPDGRRLVLSIQTLGPDGTRFVSSLWEMPSDGSAPARRLTFSEAGEQDAAFLPDGSLVFASARPDPTVEKDESEGRLWLLPAQGGDAQRVLAVPGGIGGVAAARSAGTIVLKANLFPSSGDLTQDAEKAKQRKQAGASAMLFTELPIRHWDHELGPRHLRLLRLERVGEPDQGAPEDLTADVVNALNETGAALTPDGRTVVTTWRRQAGRGFVESDLVAIDGNGRRVLADDAQYGSPAISPDGSSVVAVRMRPGVPELAPDITLWLVDLATGEGRDLTPSLDLWPGEPEWSADARSVVFTADERGHRPVFRVDMATGAVTKLTAEGCFASVCPAPDGETVFALRSSQATPAEVVRIDGTGICALPTPGARPEVAGVVSEVSCVAPDGREIRAWLITPETASAEQPAPLALWIHGGPLGSWNAWSWRWCPHLLAERGYAVLMPDPALSTGYGHDFIQHGWRRWGEVVLPELEAIVDEALRRPDLDASRTAAMGGSFGGYMANWTAGHTDRFKAIVTHASLWALDQFHATTDMPTAWERQFGDIYEDPESFLLNSPREHLENVRTPMLVIHGLRDYRVPISEGLRLWTDLQRREIPSAYLFFPDENHWILKPGNTRVWYETVLAFLDHHVLGKEWKQPDLLG
jgi:dipeptidyl aminopeptidase/acylaminoacyl peptidase